MKGRFVGEKKGTGPGISHTPAVPFRTSLILLLLLAAAGCSQSRRIAGIVSRCESAGISLPAEGNAALPRVADDEALHRDTLVVTDGEGREIMLMSAVRDEESGEMVATEQLRAAKVTARFRNVAERHGRVDIAFDVSVPAGMQNSRWQIRLHPRMYILADSLCLEDVVITGADYRKAQLRGYQQYERFLSRIVSDSSLFVDRRNLELFLERNIPEIFAFRTDSSFVSDEQFSSAYGVTARQALDHYTRKLAEALNRRRIERSDDMMRRYIKAPIRTEGIRLDSVVRNSSGDFVYCYVQTVHTRPRMRKVDVVLSGEIYEQDRCLYDIPRSDALTFYISSLSSLAEQRERYLTKVLERRVDASTTCYIDFRVGQDVIDEGLGGNAATIASIKRRLLSLLASEEFELDSITIAASASPEGSVPANNRLAAGRAANTADYFYRYVRHMTDSLVREAGVFMSLDGSVQSARADVPRIGFKSRSAGENWQMLDHLVKVDTLLTDLDKESYGHLASMQDADARERAMSSEPYYGYLRDELYPLLRTVQFNFHLHRRGMLKDTVHTTVLDSAYMKGVEALRNRDYETAVALLSPYEDCNAAVACLAMDRNLTALKILGGCESSAKVDYLKALAYSRQGDEGSAVQSYLHSCSKDPAFVHRGNLDPEIAALIRKYQLTL